MRYRKSHPADSVPQRQDFDEDYFDAAWKLSDECKQIKSDIAHINAGNKPITLDENSSML